jgi:hypothetical protein
MHVTGCGTSRERITDPPSFPFCKLAHHDLSALLLGASCVNDHCWLKWISRSISKPLLLLYSEGIAVIALQ